jgi:hypothetical protein
MFIISEFISAFILVLFIFLNGRPSHQKFRQLKIALGLFVLFQIIIYIIGSVIFYFLEKNLSEDSAIVFATSILWSTLILSLVGSIFFSIKAVKKQFG